MVTRRQLLRLLAALPGLGMCSCATSGGTAPTRSGAESWAAGPRYEGPLVDCHSHIITRTPPGVEPVSEATLLGALGDSGVEAVVAFGAAGGRATGDRVVPVLAVRAPFPSPTNLRPVLATGDYRGIKMSVRHFPFPMQPHGMNGRADSPDIQAIAATAAETGWPMTLHLDGPDVSDLSALCTAVPRAIIVWAHAGTTPPSFGGGATPATVERMLDTHPNLHVDLSARAPGWMGPLGPLEADKPLLPEAWRRVLTRHPSRILFGLDVFMARFLPAVPRAVAYWRRALGELPDDAAAQVAHLNARRIYRL